MSLIGKPARSRITETISSPAAPSMRRPATATNSFAAFSLLRTRARPAGAPFRRFSYSATLVIGGTLCSSGAEDLAIIREVHQFFGERPHDFEKCAAALARLMQPDIAELDLTRPSRDGGRDAIGKLRLGHGIASILVDFALEAKCYALDNSVGVREMSRLISRLRHRQSGILVTTSYVDLQAYREIKEDQHPIIVISARDIAGLPRRH